jgi:hypothetical protein
VIRGSGGTYGWLWHAAPSPVSLMPEHELALELSRFLRSYGGITTAEAYLERVIAVYAPPVAASEPLHPSALSLPEAIDYLNAVWRAHHSGSPLIRLGRVEVAAKLALARSTAEEFESRLSALTSVLDGMNVPNATYGGKLFELKSYLSSTLPDEAAARADAAVDDLRALFDLRVWRQHEGTDTRARRGMQRLGVTLPPADWGEAWAHVQSAVVMALSTLREEIEILRD